MTQAFLELSAGEQAEILRAMATKLGRDAQVLEKDVWVCWALQHLFAMPGRKEMAFKGGTSLSKVYGAINRFSEDIDITIDYQALAPDLTSVGSIQGAAARTRTNVRLKTALKEYVHGAVKPFFEERVKAQVPRGSVTVDEEGEKLDIHYHSALGGQIGYLRPTILIEFGGRNTTLPSAEQLVTPDLAGELPVLRFPQAAVQVLAAERTFWEKATLIHAECNRLRLQASHERWVRHWYDLAMLADHPVGARALEQRELLRSVVEHKRVFFYTQRANYDACLSGAMRLLPEPGEMLAHLENDYAAMIASGMIYGAAPSFAEIVVRLKRLEAAINAAPVAG